MPPPSRKPFPFRLEFPPELPISARAEEITAAIQAHQVVIIAGETGSGKTTQIPKMCFAAGGGAKGRIACTQPRRVAALSISRRVAEELGVEWGREVGCKIRFNDQTTPQTVIKFLTDGMLLAEMQGDPMLKEYDTVIIDEAHERSLNIDFLIGHLRGLRFRRPDLKIVITSATIDTAAFSVAFDDAPVVIVEGRTFPVEVIYAPLDGADDWGLEAPSPGEEAMDDEARAAERAAHQAEHAEALHYIDGTVEAVERVMRESTSGDLLVFLPSERDIREVLEMLEGRLHSSRTSADIVPLFGRLSNAEQQRVFAGTQRRKIVLATNIAETSLTIPGIRFVIDSGLARVSRYSPQARTRRLPIEEISQSSADQRKGRSGRVAEGVCIRLYSEKDFLERPRFSQPEIQRANLADVILRMKAFGLGDIERFPFINMPAAKAIRAGYALLEELGAIEEQGARGEEQRAKGEGQGAKGEGQGGKGGAEDVELGTRIAEDNIPIVTRGALPLAPGSSPLAPRPSPLALRALPGSRGAVAALTPIGRELARLPVDPTVGRMILQARTEKALREVIVIAAGLSIQDPRERPMDKQQAADTAHRRFAHPDSDFLTLLKIWEMYHGEFENLSQARLRRFCRDQFLSYTRMREWRDIHTQLLEVLRERDDFRMSSVFDGVQPPAHARGPTDPAAGRAKAAPKAAQGPTGKGAVSRQGENRTRLGADLSRGKPAPTADDTSALGFGSPGYRAIHRSILAGLLGNIAHLDEESGLYKATHDRKVVLFPGSVLFKRDTAKQRADTPPPRETQKKGTKNPRWIVSAEIMETSRLYARTCARLDPLWALELGAHLVRVSHSEPFWNEDGGRVMVKQRTRLYGLELETKAVSYGRIDPVHATEIFIREGLVNDTVTFPLDFISHNRVVRENLEDLLTRTRDRGYLNLDEAVYRFYAARLLPGEGQASGMGISSVGELVDLVRQRRGAEPRFLMMEPEDLRDPETVEHDAEAFPAALPLQNNALPLNYAYKPGQADDGVTLDVTVREAEALTAAALDWAVPGHLEAKVEHYMRALPKTVRIQIAAESPLGDAAKVLAAELKNLGASATKNPMPASLTDALAELIAVRFRIGIDAAVWADKPLPEHLRVRVRVLDDRGRELCASRDLAEVEQALGQHKQKASETVARVEPEAWRLARTKWEMAPQVTWAFGEIPARVLVTEQAGVPVYAYPGLVPEEVGPGGKAKGAHAGMPGVALRLFKTTEEATAATRRGVAALLERALSHDLGWLERDLKAMRELGPLISTLAPLEELQRQAFQTIRTWACTPSRMMGEGKEARTAAGVPGTSGVRVHGPKDFEGAMEKAKAELRGLVPRFVDLLREILTARQQLLVLPKPPAWLEPELEALLPRDFLAATPYEQLSHFPRYLKAMRLRAERWRQNPAKDAERAVQLAPYAAAVERVSRGAGRQALRWLVEEYKVSLFAQELGTAEAVSAVKLDRVLAAGETVVTKRVEPAPAARPIVAAPLVEKKSAPLKNLGALDKLFRR